MTALLSQVVYRFNAKVQPVQNDNEESQQRVDNMLQNVSELEETTIDPASTPTVPFVMDVAKLSLQKRLEQRYISRMEYVANNAMSCGLSWRWLCSLRLTA